MILAINLLTIPHARTEGQFVAYRLLMEASVDVQVIIIGRFGLENRQVAEVFRILERAAAPQNQETQNYLNEARRRNQEVQ